MTNLPLYGEIEPLRKRRISQETCQKFGVRTDIERKRLCFPYFNEQGHQVAWKFKTATKKGAWEGDAPKTFFGQQLWSGGKRLVITEGEIDALTFAQVSPGWPVVSIPSGCDSAKKTIQQQLRWLSGFEQVIICFDDDEAGRAARDECAPLLDPKQSYTSLVPGYNDANQALMAGKSDVVMQAIWQAKQYTPQSLIRSDDADLLKRIVEWDCQPDAHWHHPGLDEMLRGLQVGRIYTLAADTGVGKSTFLAEAAACILGQEKALGWIALEEDDVETAMRLMTIASNTPADLITDRKERLKLAELVGKLPLYLSKNAISCNADTILAELAFLVKGMNCKFLILDHLSMLMSGSETNDEQKLISTTMTKLKDFVTKTRSCLIQVVHVNTIRDGQVNLYNLRGSRTIGQLSDAVIAIERDTREGSDNAIVRVLKNRPNRGRTGIAGYLEYNPLTGRQLPSDKPPTEDDEEPPKRSKRKSATLDDPLPQEGAEAF